MQWTSFIYLLGLSAQYLKRISSDNMKDDSHIKNVWARLPSWTSAADKPDVWGGVNGAYDSSKTSRLCKNRVVWVCWPQTPEPPVCASNGSSSTPHSRMYL